MPRNSKRGGARTGTPGKSYPNRTDLATKLPATAAPGQPYGQATAQLTAQQAVPMASGPPPVAPVPAGPLPGQGPGPGGPTHPEPGRLGGLAAPTARPGEHVSTGLPIGPGAGPEALSQYSAADDTGAQLRSLYQQFPNQDLADLIQVVEANRAG